MTRQKTKNTKQQPSSPVIKQFRPKTRNQSDYVRSIIENEITFCHGIPGTGKTACAVGLAVEYLISGKVEKIVITRPIVAAATKPLGALPGGVQEKIDPYLLPIYDELESYLYPRIVKTLISEKRIIIAPLELMRGSNFHNSFIILDEAQNCTYNQLKMFVTRIGKDSKMVINGDAHQCDLPKHDAGALSLFIEKLKPVHGVGVSYLDETDIQRNPIIGAILNALGD